MASCKVLPEPFDLESAEPVLHVEEKPGKTTADPKGFRPDTTKFDWIRLKTDEWLKGEILSLREENFEFNSAEFDKLELEWKKIAEVRSSKSHKILLTNRKSYSGKIRVDDSNLFFVGDPVRRIDRSRLLAIVPGESGDRARWSGEVSAGGTIRGGNTDESDINFTLFVRRETAATRWDTKYTLDFSESRGVETANSHRIESGLDLFVTKRLYFTVPGVTYYKDRFQNIEQRISPFLAIGYDLLDRTDLTWEVSAGPAYETTEFVSVQPGEEKTKKYGAIFFGTDFEWDITKIVEVEVDYEIVVPVRETAEYNSRLEATLSIELKKRFELDISLIWDRNNGTTTTASGVTPGTDDFRTVISLSIEF